MLQDDLLGINTTSEDTSTSPFDEYIIDVKQVPTKRGPIKPNKEGQPTDYEEDPDFYAQTTGQHDHDNINSKPIGLQRIAGFFETLLAVPTYVPRSVYNQIKIVNQPDKDRIYIYDKLERKWKFIELKDIVYTTTQLQLPFNAAGDFGWDVVGTGADVSPYANGAELFSSSLEFAFRSDVIGTTGLLTFTNTKKLKLETLLIPRFTSANNKGTIGFYENDTDSPTNLVDITNVTESIRWVMLGTALYAVWANGSAVSSQLIPGALVASGTPLRLKILWVPGSAIQWFVEDVLVHTSTTNIPVSGSIYMTIAGQTISTGDSGFYTQFPRLSLEN